MRNCYLIFIVLIGGSFNSCKNVSKTTSTTTQIHVNINNAQSRNYKPLLDSVAYIPLETTNNSLIGDIGKLYITESNILVFDSKQTEILLFDKKGKFVRKIGRKGRGPGEFLFFNEIFFDRKSEIIYAHERYLNKIFQYNLEGKLLSQTSSKYDFNSFCKVENGYWVYSCFEENNPQGYNLMLLDETMQNMLAGFFPQNPAFVNVTFGSTFSQDHQGIPYFFYPTSNVIYQLVKEKPIPYYELHFGDKTMPYKEIAQLKSSNEYDQFVGQKRYLGDINSVFCYRNYLLFSFNESGFCVPVKSYSACLNTSTSEINIFNGYDHFLPYTISYTLLGTTTNALIFSIHASSLNEKGINTLQQQNINMTSDSNPILVFFYTKPTI